MTTENPLAIIKSISPACEAASAKKVKRGQQAALAAFKDFDNLPDAADVRLQTVMRLKGISAATTWRWTKNGLLPAARKTGGTTTWNVGELRRHPA